MESHCPNFCWSDLHGRRALRIDQRAIKTVRYFSPHRAPPGWRVSHDDLVRERRRRVGWDGVSWQVALHAPELCEAGRMGAFAFSYLVAPNSFIDPLDGLMIERQSQLVEPASWPTNEIAPCIGKHLPIGPSLP